MTYKNILKHKGTYIDFTRTRKMDIKQFALAVHNFAYGTNWDDEDIVSAMDFETIVEKMKKDEKELKEVKEALAQKFYDHYGGQGADTLNWARQTGPNLGNMVDFTLKENKRLEERCEAEALERDGAMDDLDEVVIEKNELMEKLEDLQQKYDHLQSVHSKVVQDLNARTEKVIEMTLQQQ